MSAEFEAWQKNPVLPICARCGRTVEAFEGNLECSRGRAGIIVFVARCHGAEETVEVDPVELVFQGELRFGQAFVDNDAMLATARRISSSALAPTPLAARVLSAVGLDPRGLPPK